jgi:rare lipoprotein A (peptidoglycan hydrolase)
MRRNSFAPAALAALGLLAALGPSSALAQTGGAQSADATFYDMPFGARDLSRGMSGTDVQTLNWVLRGLALGTPYDGYFLDTTAGAVRSFQASAALPADGVVGLTTRKALASRMLNQMASWYGPKFYGNRTACGKKLTKKTFGVAHKKLPCGTRVALAYRGRWARAKVIDRGPYVKGRKWDLTRPLAVQLGTLRVGTARVKAAVAP